MFEEFSGSYYLGRLYVEPRDDDRAVMHEEDHERLNEQVYADGEGIVRLDHPLVMKLDEAHFPVHGAADVPARTLAIPEDLLEYVRVDDPPVVKDVLLAKPGWADCLVRWFGADPGGETHVDLQ